MKRVFAVEGRPVVLDVPEPELRPGEVLVATAYSVVSSGTEMHIIHSSGDPATLGEDTYPSPRAPRPPQLRKKGVDWGFPPPRGQMPGTASVGYSLSGTVVAVSKEVVDIKVGDRVACSGNQCAVHAEIVRCRATWWQKCPTMYHSIKPRLSRWAVLPSPECAVLNVNLAKR